MKNRIISIILISFLLLTLVVGCGSKSVEYSNEMGTAEPASVSTRMNAKMQEDAVYETEEMAMDESPAEDAPDTGGSESVNPQSEGQKLVVTTSLSAETLEFDKAIEQIHDFVEKNEGYIESSSISGKSLYDQAETGSRYANFTVRIPTNERGNFISLIEENFNITSTDEYVDDISESYYDTQAWLESLEEQYNRLEDLRAKSEDADLEYLLQIETEMSNVRQQINSYYIQLKNMDKLVDYSTIHLYINEVVKYQDIDPVARSFGERTSNAFKNSWKGFVDFLQNFVVAVIFLLPFIIVLTIIVVVIIIVRRRIKSKNPDKKKTKRSKRNKKEDKPEQIEDSEHSEE